MNCRKEQFIFEIYDFTKDYKNNEELFATALAVQNGINDLIAMYFHDDSSEQEALESVEIILDTFKFHVARQLSKQLTN